MDKNGILVLLSELKNADLGRVGFAEQPIPQRVFSAIWALESEVNNGGFSQYFQNFSCETAGFAGEALDTVGAPRTAEICRRAIATAFPDGLPADAEEISSTASDFSEEIEEKLSELDAEFFKYPHNLTELLLAFVSKHPEEFGELPKPDDQ